jgi:beta-lactamase superfamily II metal-dependent hydrolase
MKLTVFQSDKGDCFLLTSADGRHMLVDGGMRGSYSKHVSPALGQLRIDGGKLDVVCVSHVDEDHISGILQMMDDEVAWRIHKYQKENGNPRHKEPDCCRPPEVGAIWHNTFHEQLQEKSEEIEEILAASAAILSGSENKTVKELAATQSGLVTGIADALKLRRRVGPDQLDIKVNGPAEGRLMIVRPAASPAIKLGRMRFYIIGPGRSELRKLREEWKVWLGEHRARLKSIQAQAKKDEARFNIREIDDLLSPKLMQANLLSELLPLSETAKPIKLGKRSEVTTPNLASLMFFVEESRKTLLLTGDGHHLDILNGLRHIKKLNGTKGIHVDVLKVQHHGSEHNLDEVFCHIVTADNYIFCGNGEHKNPDLRVLQAIADSRLGSGTQLSKNAEVSRPFKFWFNSHSTVTKQKAAKDHMKEVEKLMGKLASKSNGQMSFFFLKGSSFDIQI